MGYSVEVVESARGLSLRGTSDDKLFSGDVVRKLLVQMEQQADLSQPAPRPPPEPSVAVKVRERASRRAAKHPVDAAEAEASLAALLDEEASKLRILDYLRTWRGDKIESAGRELLPAMD